jgi:hypothetical protein
VSTRIITLLAPRAAPIPSIIYSQLASDARLHPPGLCGCAANPLIQYLRDRIARREKRKNSHRFARIHTDGAHFMNEFRRRLPYICGNLWLSVV